MSTVITAETSTARKLTKGEIQTIRRHLDALFPDSDCNTTFGPAWKDDVANHPDQYPAVMQALSTALGTQYTHHKKGE